MKGLRDGPVKTYLFLEYPRPPAGDAVERVDIGHAVSKAAAPSESHTHCKKKDDKPNLVILKVNSKRERSLRALVNCGASNNFVRLQSLARLDFEEVELPRSLLEVRLATGVDVRTEKRARFSYEEKKFVDELILLDLDDKFDMVLGMPWLARHDPVIDWAKRTIVRFRIVREKCEPNQKTQIRSDLRGSRSVTGDAVVSTVVDTQVEQEWPVTEGSDLGASAPGADAIGPNIKGHSAVRRRGKRGGSAPGADAASSADGCKRPAPEMLACSRATGLYDEAIHNQAGHEKRTAQARQTAQVSIRDRDVASSVCRADTATGDDRRDPERLDAYGYWSPVSEDGAREPPDTSVGVDFTSSYEL
ncbi:unnamed protein product [Phytophthora fragariaefolia]|uniref:Unnamed protein product n=1 Tax=Phytophthora fragariaefolia TaxID=1490495 RepID=A0A9W6Y6G7_9STRA|nr:unnamed protein product [Phytophthora fragariaefolia]